MPHLSAELSKKRYVFLLNMCFFPVKKTFTISPSWLDSIMNHSPIRNSLQNIFTILQFTYFLQNNFSDNSHLSHSPFKQMPPQGTPWRVLLHQDVQANT